MVRVRFGEAVLIAALLGVMISAPSSSGARPAAGPVAQATAQPDPDEVQQPEVARPTVRAIVLSPEAERAIQVDGRMTEGSWAGGDSISNLTTTEPEERESGERAYRSGRSRLNARPAITAAERRTGSMTAAGVPARLWTAVSTMRLWAMRTMIASTVMDLTVMGMFTATAMQA